MLPRAKITIVLSLGMHIILLVQLPENAAKISKQPVNAVSLKILAENPTKTKIISHQNPTARPDQEALESWQDHKAQRPERPREVSHKSQKKSSSVTTQEAPSELKALDINKNIVSKKSSPRVLEKNRLVIKGTTERNSYEKFLHRSAETISESIVDKVENKESGAGEKIDMDTKEYRYMGYFSSLRKAIELVWVYPMDAARRGIQGTVTLEFKIEKSGGAKNIKVLKSSGEPSLDRAIIEAITLAQPFSPLPEGLGKEKLIVTGNFNYILTGYAIGH